MLQIQCWAVRQGANFTNINFVETDLKVFFSSSIEYWFRCMDLDGDGVLSMYELEYFYSEQVSKMEVLGIETMVFEDCLCQVWKWWEFSCEGQFMYVCAETWKSVWLTGVSLTLFSVFVTQCSISVVWQSKWTGDQACFAMVKTCHFSFNGQGIATRCFLDKVS